MQPKDLIERPINEGDIIAYALGGRGSRSVHMVVGRIEKFNFKATPPGKFTPQSCPQHMAESYSIRVRPLKWTGYRAKDEDGRAKPTTVKKITNVVLLDAEVDDLGNVYGSGV